MATIGPSITFQSVGPQGSPDIAFSNLYAAFQSPWGLDGVYQVCASWADFLRLYGGRERLTTVASGQTADTYTVETDDDVVQAYHAIKAYFENKGANSPGVLFASRVCDSSAGPTATSATFADMSGSNNTTITSKWKGLHGGTTQVYIINPSPKRSDVWSLQTGTVAVSAGSAAVTGNGTTFVTGSTWEGWGIKIGTRYYTIQAVGSTTSLTLDENASAAETAAVFSVGNNTTEALLHMEHPRSGISEDHALRPTTASASDISKQSQLATVALPAGLQLPKTTAPGSSGWVKLHSGTPGTAETYDASDSDLVGTTSTAGAKTGLQVFNDQKLGTGFVVIPGKTSSTIRSGIKSHCETYYRYGLFGPTAGLTLTTAQTEFSNVSSNFGAGWVPRIWMPDEASSTNGKLLIDNVGHIAGLAARMDRDRGGPHKSPAGIPYPLNAADDVERASTTNAELFDDAGSMTLADFNVNTIRVKNGGIVSWGLRSVGPDERYRQIQVGRIVCLVYLSCFQLMEKRTFEPIDSFGKLFALMKGDLDAFLSGLHGVGALFGEVPGDDPSRRDAWRVVCDRTNNPNTEIGKGKVRADVSIVPVLNAEAIVVPIFVAAPGFGSAAAGI